LKTLKDFKQFSFFVKLQRFVQLLYESKDCKDSLKIVSHQLHTSTPDFCLLLSL